MNKQTKNTTGVSEIAVTVCAGHHVFPTQSPGRVCVSCLFGHSFPLMKVDLC